MPQHGTLLRVSVDGVKADILATGFRAAKRKLTVTFSDPIATLECLVKVWSLKRTRNCGSKHHDKRELKIRAVKPSVTIAC